MIPKSFTLLMACLTATVSDAAFGQSSTYLINRSSRPWHLVITDWGPAVMIAVAEGGQRVAWEWAGTLEPNSVLTINPGAVLKLEIFASNEDQGPLLGHLQDEQGQNPNLVILAMFWAKPEKGPIVQRTQLWLPSFLPASAEARARQIGPKFGNTFILGEDSYNVPRAEQNHTGLVMEQLEEVRKAGFWHWKHFD